jgi:signal peptidase I
VATRAEPGKNRAVSDLYAVLGLTPDASPDDIRDAYYRRLRFTELDTEEEIAQAQELRQAYEVLSDPDRRRSYDVSNGISHPSPVTVEPRRDEHHHTLNPVTHMTRNLPRGWRITIDWIVTIVGAIAIVLAIKAWVVNPYRIPSSSMEPTLHCARPGSGCEARFSDRVLANRLIYHFRDPKRKEIVVFHTPPLAKRMCGAGGTFVKRVIGLPGDVWEERSGFVYINGKKLNEPYIHPDRRDSQTLKMADISPKGTLERIPKKEYLMMGDNRTSSCDSRVWGLVPRKNLIGEVFATYWPPSRISFH